MKSRFAFNVALWFLIKILLLPVLFLLCFLSISILGFMHLEHISFIDALFWLVNRSAIANAQIQSITKIFSVFVTLGIYFSGIWIVERFFRSFFKGEGKGVWLKMKNQLRLEKLENHLIICGYGQVGRTVVENLTENKIPFVVIENDESLVKSLLEEGKLVINGDARRRGVLLQAQIIKAKGILVLIDNDPDNLYITITAKNLNPEVRIITRVGKSRYLRVVRSAGADEVIIPEDEAGKIIAKKAIGFIEETYNK
ncbi:MAG: NAD-binding protein [bacterium]|nr:NAD-binding protein [bacterium]